MVVLREGLTMHVGPDAVRGGSELIGRQIRVDAAHYLAADRTPAHLHFEDLDVGAIP